MKRPVWIFGSIVVLLALLAGAALVGARFRSLLPQPAAPVVMSSSDDGSVVTTEVVMQLDMERASEIPAGPATVKGILVGRQDNVLRLGTGQIGPKVSTDKDGTVKVETTHDGPVIEVVIVHDTAIYRDVTARQFGGELPSGQKIRQVVEPGSIDEIRPNRLVIVWGERSGDRVVATVILYLA
jgi:hypothetical protein